MTRKALAKSPRSQPAYEKQIEALSKISQTITSSLYLEDVLRLIVLVTAEVMNSKICSLMLIDEAAQVSEELYFMVRPMLAVSQGRLILLSTPHGKRAVFWRAWDQEPNWKRVKVTADQCPRISKDFLEQERRAVGEWSYA